MFFSDLAPSRAALYEIATGERFLCLCGTILDADLDPYVLIERRPPNFALRVLALRADVIEVEHEVLIVWQQLPECARFAVLEAWTEQILTAHAAWRRRINPRLIAVGARPLGPV